MKDHDQRKIFRDSVNRRLSGLQGDPWLAQRIISQNKKEEPIMKKKISMGLIFAIAAVLIAATALAAVLTFSPRYDAAKLANEALLKKYDITDKMMTVFFRETTQNDDESFTVTYTPMEAITRLGTYTVTIERGKAEAVWSHDGEDTSGGLAAAVWGAEQVEMLVTDYTSVMKFLLDESGERSPDSPDNPFSPPASIEDYEKSKMENKKKVEGAAKISLTQAKENAIMALASEYKLTKAQTDLLEVIDGDETYHFEDDRPTIAFYYHLMQGNEWMEKDGIYVVKVNLLTGEIESIIYDSGLAANG